MSEQTIPTTNNRGKWLTLVALCLGLFMIVMDGNVVNLAIPKILQSFGSTLSQMEWVNNAYLLVFAVFLITFGRLGDEIGRKKLFIAGLVSFTLGSLLCGISQNVSTLIAFRAFQALGGAAMMPATLSIISATFEKKQRGIAMGVWGAIAGLGIALGPIIGGNLTELGLGQHLNTLLHVTEFWRYVFYINLPVGILGVLGAIFFVHESREENFSKQYDIPGIILAALAVFFLTFGFIEGPTYGWWSVAKDFTIGGHVLSLGSLSLIPLFFTLAVVFFALFVLRERRIPKDPLVDLKLFQNRNFTVGNIATTILSFGMMGAFFLLPLFLQSILGFSPKESGTILLPLAIALMIAAPIAGKLSDRFGAKYMITGGLVVGAVGAFIMAHFQLTTTTRDLILPFIITGIGMGFAMAPLTNATLLDIPASEAGGASGVLTTFRQVGAVMGIAILGAFLQSSMPNNMTTHVNAIPNLPIAAKEKLGVLVQSGDFLSQSGNQAGLQRQVGALLMPTGVTKPTPQVLAQVQQLGTAIVTAGKQGFTDSINTTLKLAALFMLIGAGTSLFLRSGKNDHAPDVPTVG